MSARVERPLDSQTELDRNRRRRTEIIEKIPVLSIADARRNKNLIKFVSEQIFFD